MRHDHRRRTAILLVATCASLAFVPAAADEAAAPKRFGFGRVATPEEIAAWAIDVPPDGSGLPAGSGSVAEGKPIYAAKCAVCHGRTGVEGPNDRLVARPGEGFPTGASPDSWTSRTIGNYWPYATTVFDYIRRSMPQNLPGSLQDDEVYALTAYLLFLNGIVPEDAVMNADTLMDIRMPAQGNFRTDDRLDYLEVH